MVTVMVMVNGDRRAMLAMMAMMKTRIGMMVAVTTATTTVVGSYSTCILGVRLCYQDHNKCMFSSHLEDGCVGAFQYFFTRFFVLSIKTFALS